MTYISLIDMKIENLKNGMKKVDIEAKIQEKGAVREVTSRYTDEIYRISTCIIADDTARTKLTLWGDDIERVNEGDSIKIENGYVTAFRGELQVNIGKYGKLIVV